MAKITYIEHDGTEHTVDADAGTTGVACGRKPRVSISSAIEQRETHRYSAFL